MNQIDDLDQVVERLRRLGLDACHEFVYSPQGCLEGLDVGDDFFPLWELNLPENQEALSRMDFEEVKANRGSGWSMRPRASGAATGS